MKLNKSTSFVLINLLNGMTQTNQIASQPNAPDIRSIQRALQTLVDNYLIKKNGSTNNPQYSCNYEKIITSEIPSKTYENDDRAEATYRFGLIEWLDTLNSDKFIDIFPHKFDSKKHSITAKELEYLTIELSWKSSSLEGNTYTLLDTQLLLVEGIQAKNRTEFETQMILNHKDAIAFISSNLELFRNDIVFSTLDQLHRILAKNLNITSGIRKKLVGISASNYIPLSNPQQLKEQVDKILGIINNTTTYSKALLALALIPYLQTFEDGNKRTGRMLANAILLAHIGRGFSLRKVDARTLAIAYLNFYEFNSLFLIDKILKAELS